MCRTIAAGRPSGAHKNYMLQPSSLHPSIRLAWIDSLRGLAIVSVMLFHLTAHYSTKYPQHPLSGSAPFVFAGGWIGVYLFFLISGYIIYLTIQNKRGAIHFLIARLSRLVPPFWTSIALVLLLELAHQAIFQIPYRHGTFAVFANALMIPDELHAPELQGAYWSLFVELKFYLGFALLWRFSNLKSHRVFGASFLVLLTLWGVHELLSPLPEGYNLKYFLVFWLGIAAYKVRHENLSYATYVAIAVGTTAALGLSGDGHLLVYAMPVLALLMVVGERAFHLRWVEAAFKPLTAIGRVSYSLYLIHEPLGYVILGGLALYGWRYGSALAVAIAAATALAYLNFRYIERSDKHIANYFLRKLAGTRVLAEDEAPAAP